VIEWELFWILVLNGYLFKVMFALFDTPVIYVVVHFIRKHFDMVDVNKHLLEDN